MSTPVPTPTGLDQFQRLVRQIHLMKQYCADEGVALPSPAAESIAEVESLRYRTADAARRRADDALPSPPADSLEVVVPMALHAAWKAHAQLSLLVKPATPSSIEWTTAPREDKDGRQRSLFLYGMIGAAILVLGLFIVMLYRDSRIATQNSRIPDATALLARLADDDAWGYPANSDNPPAEVVKLAAVASEEVARLDDSRPLDNDLHDAVKPTREFLKAFLAATSITGGARPGVTPVYDMKGKRTEIVGLAAQWRSIRDDRRYNTPNGGSPDYLLLVLAGALGAAFFNLYCAHQYIVDRTFDRAYMNRYIIRFFLGMVSGLVLGHFGGELIKMVTDSKHTVALTFSRAFLAILGGYAVESVNLILVRIAEAISTLFRGSFDEILKAKTAAIEANAGKDKSELRNDVLKDLQAIRGMAPPDARTNAIDALIKRLLAGP